MKFHHKIIFITMNRLCSISLVLVASFFFISCRASTDQLAEEVKAHMIEHFRGEGITIKSLILVHEGGNKYDGVLETSEEGGDFSYDVDVVFDGTNFSWEIVE